MGRNIRKLSLFVAIVAGMYSLCNRVGGYVTPKENSVEVVKKADEVPTTTPTTVLTTVPTTKTKVNKTNKETVPTTSSGKNYPVIEKQFGEDGITYDNFCVKNYTDFSLDIATELKRGLPFKIEKNHQVQVLIFHTHTCESYLKSDTGYYPSDYYPRSTNNKENVTAVGDEIEKQLKKAGIGVIHDKTKHDYPSYNGGYDRSYQTIQKYMEKYKGIKVVLDIHRDAIGDDTSGKVKPTFKYKGKKASQIMIMTGYQYEGGGDFPFWRDNLDFAIKLQQTAETMYPGLTRPLNFGEYTYNLNVCNGSLLIEFGTDVNTIDEVKRSGKMVGKALAKVLQNN